MYVFLVCFWVDVCILGFVILHVCVGIIAGIVGHTGVHRLAKNKDSNPSSNFNPNEADRDMPHGRKQTVGKSVLIISDPDPTHPPK